MENVVNVAVYHLQLLQSLPSALVSPSTGLQTILISPQAVTKPLTQTVTVASSPATPVVTMAPSAGATVTLAAVQANQPTSEQFPMFRMPEVRRVALLTTCGNFNKFTASVQLN